MTIAMFAGLMVSAYDIHAYAFKSGTTKFYCYNSNFGSKITCFTNNGECSKAQKNDGLATSGCYQRDTKP